MLGATLIKTHNGSGWNADVETSVYKKDEYTIIEIRSKESVTEVKFRNVGELNPDSAIQFSLTEHKKRAKHISFSIPYALCDLFIQGLMNVKQKSNATHH